MKEKEKSPSPIAWALGQTGEHKGQYVLSVILAVIGVAFSIAPYFVVAGIVHGLMSGNKDLSYYMIRCLIIAAFWFCRVLFHALSTSTSHRATFAVLGEIRKRCTEKLTRMPLGAVLEQSSGALKNTLIERIDSIETTLAHIVPEFTANLLIPVIILIYIFTIDWRMGLASLATIPVGFFCYGLMMKGSPQFYQRTVTATKALNDTAVEYIGGIQVIKVFGNTKNSYDRFVHDAYEAAHSYIDWMRSCIIPFTFAMVIMPATMVSVLPIGGLLVKTGLLSPQNLVTIIILSVGIITPLITLMSYSDDIRTMGTVFGEIQRILNAPEMERPLDGTVPKKNTLKLQDVRFSYKEKEVLHGISMEIPEGSFIALVGPSGSGKSTIARLIASLWDVSSGSILLGDTDIREIPQEAYSDKIAFVSQDNYLFNMTVRENIRIGRADATDAEVEEAAKHSGCHEFILELEHGYDTVVGTSGGHLSGGERQRISIARAMLKAAPIIILDEATAYTDPENEAVIQRSISKLTEGKTLIVIAHRLSTITAADCIYVIKDGAVADSGTHDELLSRHGLYETMWNAHIEVKDHA
ncbi:ABC transporter ATP-binding protein [Treponema lecithinolyticum]|uniref:ABC transporter, ATP-binding protein n=1 Tax=Treponema lecithinolyticum ATCC 700332 TaxID=1321815 RepID=A0ABN0NYU7_TRELE|nr:ABC transporter ATP-binding protein [Treponema lecithinolyticum]ERJ93187.1 ABC transporter, ATP-binding protein [Treponema lecithinolyticum ATCC 700332]